LHHIWREYVFFYWKMYSFTEKMSSVMTSRVPYLSEGVLWQYRQQNRRVFSINKIIWGTKKDKFWGQLSRKRSEVRTRIVGSKPLGAYTMHCSDLTWKTLNRIQSGQISDLCRLAPCRPIWLRFSYFVPLCTANHSCKFRRDWVNNRDETWANIWWQSNA
jgi:hypothetical protein